MNKPREKFHEQAWIAFYAALIEVVLIVWTYGLWSLTLLALKNGLSIALVIGAITTGLLLVVLLPFTGIFIAILVTWWQTGRDLDPEDDD